MGRKMAENNARNEPRDDGYAGFPRYQGEQRPLHQDLSDVLARPYPMAKTMTHGLAKWLAEPRCCRASLH